MIHLGIIGTNWITHQFVEAAIATKEYQLTAVYSRKRATAETFAARYEGEIQCATDLDEFVQMPQLEAIYIASPNSLHFSQAKAAILANKHVIVEKPAFSTPKEMAEIIQLAKEHQVCFFEAARNIHEDNFKKIAEMLPEPQEIIGANFSYMKYSSRYDAVLAGEEPNIFSPKFSGGSLADLGVYPVYAAVAWFGMPTSVHHFARKIVTGVDGIGTAILRYDHFDVTIQHGKIGDSFLPSEIYTTKETLVLSSVNSISQVTRHQRVEPKVQETLLHVEENPMVEEARVFAKIINHPAANEAAYQQLLDLAKGVNELLYEMRKQVGVVYAADEE
ncbi:Gfo/Idh/MocA family protein [Enterococcus sp. LJL98]